MRLIIILICFVIFSTYVFAQDNTLPAPTISVENPIMVHNSEFTLAWDQIDLDEVYYFEFCEDNTCTNKIETLQKVGSPQVSLSNIPNGQYFWRVSMVNKNSEFGLFTQLQPIVVELSENKNTQNTVSKDKDIKSFTLTTLPWYVYLVFLLYIFAFTKILALYLNK